jgi:Pyruvate/2-oxoacid:ferredoxin oxidoreductase delta subunit
MCAGDLVADAHICVDACPVCSIFTPENVLEILSGGKIELGAVDLFLQVAQIGCRLCQSLCELWSLNEEVKQYVLKALPFTNVFDRFSNMVIRSAPENKKMRRPACF